jgi:hypothetical protein
MTNIALNLPKTKSIPMIEKTHHLVEAIRPYFLLDNLLNENDGMNLITGENV